MAMNNDPVFSKVPAVPGVELTAASTTRDGSGANIVDLYTVPADHAYCVKIRFMSAQAAAAATSARVVRVYITDTGGINPRLWEEKVFPASTPSTTVIGTVIDITIDFPLKQGQKIQVAQSIYAGVQDKMHVVMVGSEYAA